MEKIDTDYKRQTSKFLAKNFYLITFIGNARWFEYISTVREMLLSKFECKSSLCTHVSWHILFPRIVR